MTICVKPAFCLVPLALIGAVKKQQIKGFQHLKTNSWEVVLFLLVLVIGAKVIEASFFFGFQAHTCK